MFVREVSLRHFRNMGCQSVFLSPGVNVFYGKNAQGKTNLLESVFLLSCPKGFRQGRERDYIAFDETAARVLLHYHAFGRDQTLELQLSADARKSILLNGVPIRKNGELASQFCTVLFEPGHLDLVKEGPEQRRHFLDTAISQLRPKYQSALESYSRVIAQKNMLLKKSGFSSSLPDMLEVWNERLADLGSYITLQRGSYVRKLSAAAAAHHARLSHGKETLFVEYRAFCGAPDEALITSLSELRSLLLEQLRREMPFEMERGMCMVGPHRDDMELLIDGRSARLFGSQGQQRSVVLSLKLGECELVEQTVGESPILLLDDVMSELDRARQQYVKSSFGARQVLITNCGRARPSKKVTAFSVADGRVTRLDPPPSA